MLQVHDELSDYTRKLLELEHARMLRDRSCCQDCRARYDRKVAGLEAELNQLVDA